MVKENILIFTACLFMLSIIGCQESAKKEKPVDVVIEGGGEFPSFLVGSWIAEGESGWVFDFMPDGSISSAVISLGKVRIMPGKITEISTWNKGKGVFEPGKWTVLYDPGIRELTVKVVINHFHTDMGPNALEGKAEDFLTGTISEDGGTWEADWFAWAEYIAYTPKPNKLPLADTPEFRGSLIFRKLTEY